MAPLSQAAPRASGVLERSFQTERATSTAQPINQSTKLFQQLVSLTGILDSNVPGQRSAGTRSHRLSSENNKLTQAYSPAGDELNHVATAIFGVVGYDYMITGRFCASEPNQTSTYHAVRKVLNPTSISKALASLATETSTKPALSMGAQVGIGVGIGIGAPIIILCAAVFIWHRRSNRRQQNEKSLSRPGSPVEPRSPHADYSWFKDQSKPNGAVAELLSNKARDP